jgi:hypothetical protein
MNTILLVLGGVWLLFLVVFIFEVLRAPVGYEDSDGFHYSNSPKLPGMTRKRTPSRAGVKRTFAKG